MSELHQMQVAARYRYQVGCDILRLMEERDELPLPNIHRVAKVMQEVFTSEGMVDGLVENGYRWRPTVEYWKTRMSEICDHMRKEHGLFFMFVRDQGQLKGQWKFVGMVDFVKIMKRDAKDIETRGETYNNKAQDGVESFEEPDIYALNVSKKLLS